MANNTTGHDLAFFVKKQETGFPAIESVSADGKTIPFELREGYLDLRVPVASGQTCSIVVLYKGAVDLGSISIAHSSFRAYFLREISDFRDIALSRLHVGRSSNI